MCDVSNFRQVTYKTTLYIFNFILIISMTTFHHYITYDLELLIYLEYIYMMIQFKTMQKVCYWQGKALIKAMANILFYSFDIHTTHKNSYRRMISI